MWVAMANRTIEISDVTIGETTIPADETGSAHLTARENGVMSGIDVFAAAFAAQNPAVTVTAAIKDGERFQRGQILATVKGPVRDLLTAERIALNFTQRMSGIATMTAAFVDAVNAIYGDDYDGPVTRPRRYERTRIVDTRKTTPGMRVLDKMAVKIGGGENHRMGLFDMILLKDNHIDFAGGIRKAIHGAREYLRAKGKDIPIECEVRSLEDIDEVFAAGGVDRIMFDNFTPAMTREAVKKVAGRCETESSGGITLSTMRDYAECGVDFISVGALTHQIKSLDMSLKACE